MCIVGSYALGSSLSGHCNCCNYDLGSCILGYYLLGTLFGSYCSVSTHMVATPLEKQSVIDALFESCDPYMKERRINMIRHAREM